MFETWVSDDCVAADNINKDFHDTYTKLTFIFVLFRRMILKESILWLLQRWRTPVTSPCYVIPMLLLEGMNAKSYSCSLISNESVKLCLYSSFHTG